MLVLLLLDQAAGECELSYRMDAAPTARAAGRTALDSMFELSIDAREEMRRVWDNVDLLKASSDEV